MKKLQLGLAALAVAGTLSLTMPTPALADGAASTRNIIFGAAAIAGIAIEANVAHKNAQANRISGYLPNGSAVYGDGHVTNRDGSTYYPANYGQNVSCNNGNCSVANAAANQNGSRYNGGYAGYVRPNNGWNADNRANANNGWNTSSNDGRNRGNDRDGDSR